MARRRTLADHLPVGDDGRVIADMNVEGMPWYRPELDGPGKPGKNGVSGREGIIRPGNPLSREEARVFTLGALKAGLAVAGFMSLGLALLVLFLQLIWN